MGERREGQPVQNLEDINFDIELADESERSKSETQTIPTIFNGNMLELRVNKSSVFEKGENTTYANLKILVYREGNEVGFLNMNITRKDSDDYKVSGDIANYRKSKLPGLGQILWEMTPRFIQKTANKLKTNITHRVNKVPRRGLTPNKWDKIFLPLFEKYGYSPTSKKSVIDHDTWEKTYTPENN